ncbi:MAG: acyl carrier protein [Candidatus Omnitrophota bacterium]|jgi:acyl carrier protein
MSQKNGTDIKNELRKFIIDHYFIGFGKSELSDDDSFLEKGIIDSIGVIELAAFIQKRYSIRIKPPEIIPENFDTLNNLERCILKKLK